MWPLNKNLSYQGVFLVANNVRLTFGNEAVQYTRVYARTAKQSMSEEKVLLREALQAMCQCTYMLMYDTCAACTKTWPSSH